MTPTILMGIAGTIFIVSLIVSTIFGIKAAKAAVAKHNAAMQAFDEGHDAFSTAVSDAIATPVKNGVVMLVSYLTTAISGAVTIAGFIWFLVEKFTA
jgi:hypothetical protein